VFAGADALLTPVTLLMFNIGLDVWESFKSKPMELTKVKSLHGIIDTITALALKSEGPETSKLQSSFKERLLEFVENVSAFCVSMFMSSTDNKGKLLDTTLFQSLFNNFENKTKIIQVKNARTRLSS